MIETSTLRFLKLLSKNNNKSWFDAHRIAYDEARDNFCSFITEVVSKASQFDSDLIELEPKKCLFRINRDVRFSANKSPYKNNFGASMDRGGKKSGFAGYYFHLEPGNSFYGGGLWQPEKENLQKVRQEIDYCFDEFRKIVESRKMKSTFGEMYTGDNVQLSKVPHGFEKDNPAAYYLRFKSWLYLKYVPDSEITSSSLVKKTVDAYKTMMPVLKFINRAIEITT